MRKSIPYIRWATVAQFSAILAFSNIAYSQEEGDEDIFELSPFEVQANSDEGYRATSTLSGSRLNTQVRDLAAPISILTDEFLQDIGATNFDDIVEFMPSSETYNFDDSDVRGEQRQNGRTFSSRGFRSSAQSRGFFNTEIPLDTYNTGPISFNRGPNSLLFGIGSAGGGLSFDYRQAPLDRVTNEVQMRFDSDHSQRYVLRHSRPLVEDKLGMSLSVLQEDRRGFRNPEYADRTSATLGFNWRPTQQTSITLNLERGRREAVRPYPFAPIDYTQEWDGVTTTPAGSNSNSNNFGAGIRSMGNNKYVVTPGTEYPIFKYNRSWGHGNWTTSETGGRTRVTTDGDILMPNGEVLPLETNLAGYGDKDVDEFESTNIKIQQRILPGLYAELAARKESVDSIDHDMLGGNDRTVWVDVNEIQPDGSNNEFFGQYYIESRSNKFTYGDSNSEAWRASLAYEVPVPERLGKLRLASFYSSEESDRLDFRLTQRANNQDLRHRVYLGSETGFFLPDGLDVPYTQDEVIGGNFGVPAIATVWEEGTRAGDRNARENSESALSTVVQALLLDQKLSIIGGFRTDEYRGIVLDPDAPSDLTSEGDTRTMGAVYHLTEKFSLFTNWGENFNPDGGGRISLNNERIQANLGESQDFGIRFSLLERKLTGGITFYETKQANQLRNDLGNVINDFDDVWDTLDAVYNGYNDGNGGVWQALDPAVIAAAGLPASAPVRPVDATSIRSGNATENNGNPGAIYADTLDATSKGLEFELIANPTENWRVSFSVSKHLSTVSSDRNIARPIYNEYLPIWEQYVDAGNTILVPGDPVDGNGDPLLDGNGDAIDNEWIAGDNEGLSMAELLFDIQDAFDASAIEVGGQRYGNREWSSNLVTRYSFTEGKLKGWNVGGSVRWRDEALVGYGVDPTTARRDPNLPFFNKDYYTVDAFVGFTTRFNNGVRWTSTLRVRNLTESDPWTTVAAAEAWTSAPAVPRVLRNRVMAPISVDLSTSFRW